MIEAWPEGAGEADLLTRARSALPEIVEQLEAVQVSLGGIADELRASEETSRAERAEADEKAREIRIRLEKMQEGAGAITRGVQALQEQANELAALRSLRQARTNRLRQVTTARDEVLAQVDEARESRFRDRSLAARRLTKDLGPNPGTGETIRRRPSIPRRDSRLSKGKRSALFHPRPVNCRVHEPPRVGPRRGADGLRCHGHRDRPFQERSTRVLSQLRTVGAEEILTAPSMMASNRHFLMARSTSQRLIFPPDKDVPLSCRLSSITGASQSWLTSPRTIWTTPSSLRRLSLPCGIVQAVTTPAIHAQRQHSCTGRSRSGDPAGVRREAWIRSAQRSAGRSSDCRRDQQSDGGRPGSV